MFLCIENGGSSESDLMEGKGKEPKWYRLDCKSRIQEIINLFLQEGQNRDLVFSLQQTVLLLEDVTESSDEVMFHGYTHAVQNTLTVIDSMRNMQNSSISHSERPLTVDAILVTAIAGLLHDTGYYSKDEFGFGTIKVDHELRSKQFVRAHAGELGIDSNIIPYICLIIAATQSDIQPSFWNDLDVAIDNLLKDTDNTEAVQEFVKLIVKTSDDNLAGMTMPLTFEPFERSELYFLKDCITGARLLAAVDIYDTRETAISMMEGLRLEFERDRKALCLWLNNETGHSIKYEDINAMMNSTTTDAQLITSAVKTGWKVYNKQEVCRAVREFSKIPVQRSHMQQIAGTADFYRLYADERVEKLQVWANISKSAKASYSLNRSVVLQAAAQSTTE